VGGALLICFVVAGCVVYFIPAIIGWNKKNAVGIAVLNLFLDWTLLGWCTCVGVIIGKATTRRLAI